MPLPYTPRIVHWFICPIHQGQFIGSSSLYTKDSSLVLFVLVHQGRFVGSSPGSAFRADSYSGIRSTPVTAVARKDPGHSAKSAGGRLRPNTYTPVRMWLCMKWPDMVHGCMVYTKRSKTAAVSRGTSHVTTKQRCKNTTLADIQNALWKASQSFGITCFKSAVSLPESGELTALYKFKLVLLFEIIKLIFC